MEDMFGDLGIVDAQGWRVSEFSAGGVNSQKARLALEERYWPITEITERFNRQSVSYQLSKRDCLHKWLKYKEGFSAELVSALLRDFRLQKGDLVVDPFMGSGTTALVSMFNGYFTELTFLFSELYRVCKTGAYVAFVNDNVRYAGEVIPVDFLTTNLAEQIGFTPVKIYTLKQQKGNSSQQMKKYGRVALRKSITIWQK